MRHSEAPEKDFITSDSPSLDLCASPLISVPSIHTVSVCVWMQHNKTALFNCYDETGIMQVNKWIVVVKN